MSHDDLEIILAQLLECEDAGDAPGVDRLVLKYPQYASELRAFLANGHLIQGFALPLHVLDESPPHANESHQHTGHSARERVGNYELVDQIAHGGMGVIYRAQHAVVGRTVALKMIREGRFASETQRQRFLIEARAAARLDHPNIVPLYDVGEHDGQPYFTMKLVSGPSLADHLKTWVHEPRSVARIVLDLARALHYAHQRGIMHRDLKPANILLEETAGNGQGTSVEGAVPEICWRPLIADFGLAKLEDSNSDLTRSGDVIGTPAYMAPEQAAGSVHEIATTTDIYSLGAILYALLTGQPLFHGCTPAEALRCVIEVDPPAPRKVNARVPADLETICLKCIEKEPWRRFGSADALADDLQRWLEDRPIHARRSGIWEHALKWARRRPAAAALIGVATAATVVLLAGSFWYNARLKTEIANVQRESQRAQDNLTKAEYRELTARRHAYAANMSQAYQAWDAGQMAQALRLLQAQVPDDKQRDLRSFDWGHLSHLAHRDLRQVFSAGANPARGVHFSPDSGQLIYGCADGAVRVRDLRSGENRDWKGHDTPIRSTAISPSGDCVATLDNGGVLRVWNLPDGSERFSRQPNRIPVFFYTATSLIAFTPDSSKLALISDGVVILDAKNGQPLGDFRPAGDLTSATYMQDSRTLVVGTNNSGILLVGDGTADQSTEILGSHNSYVLGIALSPDGKTLASSSEDGVVKLWDLKNRKEVAHFDEHTGSVYSLKFAPDGSSLASGSEDGTVKVRDLASGSLRLYPHPETVYSLAFSDDGKVLATGDAKGQVRLWDQQASGPEDLLQAHLGLVYSLSFSSDGRTLASGGKDQTIRIWNVETGEQQALLAGHTGSVTGLAHLPGGSTLVSGNTRPGDQPPNPGDEAGSVRLWDLPSRRLIWAIPAHAVATWGLAVAADGQTFATAGYTDKSVKLWDVKTRQLLATLTGHKQRIWSVAFSPDGTKLASSSASDSDDEETVFIWDVATRLPRHRLKVRWVWSVAFSPDGELLATGSEGGLVKLWHVESGTEVVYIQGHTTAVKCVAFSPDGKILASASADKTIRLWDVVTGDERATLKGHHNAIFSLAFSPDGRTLASGDYDGTIRLWRGTGID